MGVCLRSFRGKEADNLSVINLRACAFMQDRPLLFTYAHSSGVRLNRDLKSDLLRRSSALLTSGGTPF